MKYTTEKKKKILTYNNIQRQRQLSQQLPPCQLRQRLYIVVVCYTVIGSFLFHLDCSLTVSLALKGSSRLN